MLLLSIFVSKVCAVNTQHAVYLRHINDGFDLWFIYHQTIQCLEKSDKKTIVDKNPKMKETFTLLSHISANDKLRMREEHRRMKLSQYNTDMNASFEKRIEHGLQKGMQKGRMETVRENARSMKIVSLPIAMISRVTGLSVEEIDSL